MGQNRNLDVYLTEHLAGAVGAVEMVTKAAANNRGRPIGEFLERLRDVIDEDRATLDALMTRLGIQRSEVKKVAGRAVEKLSRLRLHEKVTGSADVSLLLELEALTMGVAGKLSLCHALEERAIVDDRIAEFDVGTLISRARTQLDDLERHRREVAARALSAAPPRGAP